LTPPDLPSPAGGPGTEPFPLKIDLIRAEQALEILWEDGHPSRYEAAGLRWACPCAQCRGEMGMPGRLDQVAEETEIADVGLVGSYAIQIAFSSGHATGIYTFRHLRRLCPCPECRTGSGGS
jgi:DUF971 family protein